MSSTYLQMHLILRFILLDLIICMLRQEGAQRLMESLIGMIMARRRGFRLYLHLRRSFFALRLCRSFSRKFVALIYLGLRANRMSVMLMAGLLSRVTQNIGMIVLLFSEERYLKSSFLIYLTPIVANTKGFQIT